MGNLPEKQIRAHHVANLYFDYLDNGKMSVSQPCRTHLMVLKYPLLVVDTIDDECRQCRTYPLINFCRGENNRMLDHEAAEILGIKINEEYSKKELLKIFQTIAIKQGIEPGTHRVTEFYLEKFYGRKKL